MLFAIKILELLHVFFMGNVIYNTLSDFKNATVGFYLVSELGLGVPRNTHVTYRALSN